ncbi:hypothetical protein Syun_012414 [Stephania yunnanensis]|uniref:Uncharacterized protein n=1 Tax=Stephania yunnanensis TaxID=152371 RepID=A0AAP0K057_9MAGN
MQSLKLSSFFLTNNIGAPQGDMLGRMNPNSNNSFSWALCSSNSLGAIFYGGIELSLVPGTKSMMKSISLGSGNLGSSVGKTIENSHTTDTSSILISTLPTVLKILANVLRSELVATMSRVIGNVVEVP